jgi:hypothetical protein
MSPWYTRACMHPCACMLTTYRAFRDAASGPHLATGGMRDGLALAGDLHTSQASGAVAQPRQPSPTAPTTTAPKQPPFQPPAQPTPTDQPPTCTATSQASLLSCADASAARGWESSGASAAAVAARSPAGMNWVQTGQESGRRGQDGPGCYARVGREVSGKQRRPPGRL